MQAAADMPKEMTKKENEEPVNLPINSTIISTNGLKITSKLNPDAKEFYPAYLMRQKILREIGDVGACASLTQPSLHFAHNANVFKVIKLDGIAANQMESDVDTLKGELKIIKSTGGSRSEVVDNVKSAIVDKPIMATKEDGYENEKEQKQSPENECNIVDKRLSVGTEEMKLQIEEDFRPSEEDTTDFENFEDAEGEPMLQLVVDEANKAHLKSAKNNENEMPSPQGIGFDEQNALNGIVLNNNTITEDLSDEDNLEQYSDQGSNETLNEFKFKEDTESVEVSELSEENELAEEEALHELPQILEDIKESNILRGDGDGDNEADAEAVCECVGVGEGDVPDHIINIEASKLPSEDDTDLATGGSHAPPNTPTEVSSKSAAGKTRFSKGKLTKDKEDKKKSEKRTTLRKLASISLSFRGKNSSAHHADKATPRSSSSAMTRTKRLSESLHNLTSGLKSKTDSKKTEGSSRFLPHSATNIPRPPASRTRTLLTRATTEANGMNYKAPKIRTANHNTTTINNNTTNLKDAMPLKSPSSSEQNFAIKNTTQSVKKPLSSKSANATGEKSSIPTVAAAKFKDSVGKTRPRGTHASTLRQNEAQKRRSLFPNDDAASNIELSQFLFK